ncbi:hypothetical protein ADU72_1097 [Pediococcus damnosus]|uniref:Bacteriocin immunity protein n=1 Tax=Pediococcus damnosus TaxID=51663 RepID=A0AAC9B2A1_9LACO|nr:hypothetical protein [Pediococcus damnosus]AMV63079.1 hypothetical protein ADU70_1599 [Pediococcus damnosus]AMV64766.1 hypothetical protein ADU71_0860 [Pediococcus damnosus]AMV67030.1 hypothetical protein ADU72_1097 [Pediococcus damnosus]AMV69367.1 hypothetical protein ADU73_0961 [Pediococcus damnosus]KJU74379.1 bacteriocin immunity protein [Pediococcus damnosus LMG 28219]
MESESEKLFSLIDAAYGEDLSNQPFEYKQCLLKRAKELTAGADELKVCREIWEDYRVNYIVPMSFPNNSRILYAYVKDQLGNLSEKQLRDANLGYGLIATHITFGPFN